MESVTRSSNQKNVQQADRTDAKTGPGWFATGPALALLMLICLLLAWDIGRYFTANGPAHPAVSGQGAVNNHLPWPGAVLLYFQPVDINSASVEELDMLPGVGEKTAAALLNFRMRRGFLLTVDELDTLYGPFGTERLEYLKNYLTTGD